MTKREDPGDGTVVTTKWAQLGYIRHRSLPQDGPPSTVVSLNRFYEIQSSNTDDPADYLRVLLPPPIAGDLTYMCYLIEPTNGKWRFDFNGDVVNARTIGSGWSNDKGTRADFCAEILNSMDQMVGTDSARCRYQECGVAINNADFVATEFVPDNIFTDDPSQWGKQFVDARSFDVWDKVP